MKVLKLQYKSVNKVTKIEPKKRVNIAVKLSCICVSKLYTRDLDQVGGLQVIRYFSSIFLNCVESVGYGWR